LFPTLKEATAKLLADRITREACLTSELLINGKASKLDALQSIYWQLRTFLEGLQDIAKDSGSSLEIVLLETEEALTTHHNIVTALIGDKEVAK